MEISEQRFIADTQKLKVSQAQYDTLKAVNTQRIDLHKYIGKSITIKQGYTSG